MTSHTEMLPTGGSAARPVAGPAVDSSDGLVAGPAAARQATMDVLVVEDDAVDAYLVQELLGEADPNLRLSRATDLRMAESMLSPTLRCAVLDLNLPDATGLDGLRRLLAAAPALAVVVLTGMHDDQLGVQAVAAGAQDYLTKGEIDGPLLARTIRYAVERHESHRYLVAAELHAQENARLERGLLPAPEITSAAISCDTSYQPGRPRTLLGGDFYDVVETADGTVHAVIGDVCGHGPDEAALGVCLRVAWRSLVLAGLREADLVRVLEQLLVAERRSGEIFATLCMLTLAPGAERAGLLSAGHPPPLLLDTVRPAATEAMPSSTGPALGICTNPSWTTATVELTGSWALLLFTDGIIEGRIGKGSERLGVERLAGIVESRLAAGERGSQLLRSTVAELEALDGGSQTDDIAALLVSGRESRP